MKRPLEACFTTQDSHTAFEPSIAIGSCSDHTLQQTLQPNHLISAHSRLAAAPLPLLLPAAAAAALFTSHTMHRFPRCGTQQASSVCLECLTMLEAPLCTCHPALPHLLLPSTLDTAWHLLAGVQTLLLPLAAMAMCFGGTLQSLQMCRLWCWEQHCCGWDGSG
jgi:hypothetical protein